MSLPVVSGPDFDPDTIAEVIHRYTAGETMEQLAAQYSVSYRQVRNVLIFARVTIRPQKILLPPTPPGLVNAYLDGRTIQQLATTHGRSYNQTRRILLAEGVQLRRRGRR
ncbi:helix-turn-helix domain-containing protein [Amycolatopsis sp. NBC_01480]|uniref:helix-turn-helix domain-containing protein n=1 Tax=Amycolatopsis sp. NBC_01480 TaxID=2903562 RepID=UPI002E2D7EEA|nr:helix-turn-helix domain-containing protein [Amycolatopsis sp. NBC_01480]